MIRFVTDEDNVMTMLEAGYKNLLRGKYTHEEFERFKAYWDTRQQCVEVSAEVDKQLERACLYLLGSFIWSFAITTVIPFVLFSLGVVFKDLRFARYSFAAFVILIAICFFWWTLARRKLINHNTQHGLNSNYESTFEVLTKAKDNMELFAGFVFRWDEEQANVQERYRALAIEAILSSIICDCIEDQVGKTLHKGRLHKLDRHDIFGLGCEHGYYYRQANRKLKPRLEEIKLAVKLRLIRV